MGRKTKTSAGSVFAERGLAADCSEIGLDCPDELLDDLDVERPGEAVALIYCWQAFRAFLGLSERDQELAGNCLGLRNQPDETLLTEIDGALSLLFNECREDQPPGRVHSRIIAASLMTYAAVAGEQLRALRSHPRSIPPLRGDDQLLRATERFDLTARGVKADQISAIEGIIHWLQMAAWAMACVATGGRRYLASISSGQMIERPCAPGMTDRLLLRLGANRVPLVDSPGLDADLPVTWRRCFWIHDLPLLDFDLKLGQYKTLPITAHQLAQVQGRSIQADDYKFRLGRSTVALRGGTAAATRRDDRITALIWTPAGMMIGFVHLTEADDGSLRLILHIPLIESRSDDLTDIQAIQVIQGLQALMTTAISSAVSP